MDIGDLLDRLAISPRVTAGSKRQALGVVAEVAARLYGVKPGEALDALMAREANGSTGVGAGVAVPHARLKGLDRIHGVFLRLDKPVDFEAVDDQPVDLVFALLAPPGVRTQHLRALARIARALRRPELRQQLRQARTQDAVHAILASDVAASAA
jgi:PTS system nitrogen regulatory IIA component